MPSGTILTISKNSDLIRSLEQMLRSFSTFWTRSFVQAREIVRKERIDLILYDTDPLDLERLLEAKRALKKNIDRPLTFLFLFSQESVDDVFYGKQAHTVLESNHCDYLKMPFERHELEFKIKKCIHLLIRWRF